LALVQVAALRMDGGGRSHIVMVKINDDGGVPRESLMNTDSIVENVFNFTLILDSAI
jgi:hypothetical protein